MLTENFETWSPDSIGMDISKTLFSLKRRDYVCTTGTHASRPSTIQQNKRLKGNHERTSH